MIKQKQLKIILPAGAATFLMIAASGCGTSPETHYYTLSSAPLSAISPAPLSAEESFAIGAVTLPRILDQPQIARRTGPNQMEYAEFERWAAALDDLVRHALTEDLTTELGMPVLPSANAAGGTPQQTLQLDIERFEADKGGAVSLVARWTVSGMDYPPTIKLSGHAEISTPSLGSSAPAVAQTMSRALGSLGNQIAQTVRAARSLPPTPIASAQRR